MTNTYIDDSAPVLINGGTVPVVVTGTPAAGKVIAADSGTAASWQDVGAGTITLSGDVVGAANANTLTLAGDVSGRAGTTVVASAAGAFTIHSEVFQDGKSGVTTTDATLTTLYTDSAIPASACYDYVVTVVGIEPSTLDVYRADLAATYINTAGTVTAIGAAPVALNVRATTNGLTFGGASLAISSTAILVQVTGKASTTIDWACSVSRIKAS